MFCFCCNPSTPLSASRFFAEAVTDTSSDVARAMQRRAAYERRKTYSRAPVSHPGRIDMIIRHVQLSSDPVDIHVQDGEIVAIGVDLAATAMLEVDGRGLLALPGMRVDHSHLMADRFGAQIGQAESADIYRACRFALQELMSAGATNVRYCPYGVPDRSVEAALLALIDSGLRGAFDCKFVGGDLMDELAERWPTDVSDRLIEIGGATDASREDCKTTESRLIAADDLAVGQRADLILIDAVRTGGKAEAGMGRWSPYDIGAANVVLVCVDGRVRKRNGVVVDPNEGLICKEAAEVWERLQVSAHQQSMRSW